MEHWEGLPRVAYFSMEFGLHEDLPIYAGGLGILAGDILKGAHDLGYPMVGVGILWQEGYVIQRIGPGGYPEDSYRTIDTGELSRFLEDTGVVVHVTVGQEQVPCRVWLVEGLGNVPLYLLDTNIPGSPHSWITRRLYGGSNVDRVAQEIVLGIGGIRALRSLNCPVDIYHFNEGHAVLAGLELLRERLAAGSSFTAAWHEVRTHTVFTTHTPVMAGNESHPHDLLFSMKANNGLTYEQMVEIGGDPFSMTVTGLRLSQMANGVSITHGVTAREMWADIAGAAPILSITNGIHVPTWQDRRIKTAHEAGRGLLSVHETLKAELLQEVERLTGRRLPQNALLIGFARRAAPYKRSDLILRRPDVIQPLLQSGEVAIIFAGKAHPQDEVGKNIVANLYSVAAQFPGSVVFLENYDMRIAKMLVRGCDVWLNNPRRPLEASGTSGMKAAVNGVLNVSTMDGWWPEACLHGVNGWQIGYGYQGPDQNERDLVSLYETLLNEVLPVFRRDRQRWEDMMFSSIDTALHLFSARRMVSQYYNLMYMPLLAVQEAERMRVAVSHQAQG
ncbi:MAG TPA: alpha-glucan family phosphorylase [Firmicutes bacterium]|nr:alpha-glucan family phosphorylase [Bacillota bacterium]